MSASLPSPPISRDGTPNGITGDPRSDDEDQSLLLDTLLERYLELLDDYTSLTAELSTHFAEGFFSLARAQRTSNLGFGQRYGQNGFDQRMKALSRVQISQKHVRNLSTIDTFDGRTTTTATTFQGFEKSRLATRSVSPQDSTPGKGEETTTQTSKTEDVQENNASSEKDSNDQGLRDPATWYGVLVPQMLRQTQSHFKKSVTDLIPSILSTRSSMVALERQIRDVRSQIEP